MDRGRADPCSCGPNGNSSASTPSQYLGRERLRASVLPSLDSSHSEAGRVQTKDQVRAAVGVVVGHPLCSPDARLGTRRTLSPLSFLESRSIK